MTDALFLSDGRPVADSVVWAIRASEKVRGLLGTCRLSEGQALVIVGARQVHTFGMGYAIDVLFCDADWIVRHRVHRLGPNRITRWVRRAWFVIELPGGAAGAVDIGDRLEWVPTGPPTLPGAGSCGRSTRAAAHRDRWMRRPR